VTLDAATGKQNTIGWIGCAITCFSMIDAALDPGAMDLELTDASAFYPGSRDLSFPKAANDRGYSYLEVSDPTFSQIEDALCGKGDFSGSNYVIAEVAHNGHSHFVVVTGEALNPFNDCDFTIADPGMANYTFLSLYTGSRMPISIRVLTK
jgi:hypothetical protein